MTESLCLAHFQAPVLRLPAVKRLLTHAMLTAQLRRRHTSFRLLQHPYNLLLRVSALPHLKSSSSGPRRPNLSENSHFRWTQSRDAAQREARKHAIKSPAISDSGSICGSSMGTVTKYLAALKTFLL